MTSEANHQGAPVSPTTETPSVAQLRHKAEVPMLVMAGVVTMIGIGVAIAAVAGGTDIPGWAQGALVGLLVPLFAGLVIIRFTYWTTVTNGVELGPRQLPEIYETYLRLAQQMGMEEVPRLYMVNGNGSLNAFASKCTVRRKYVVIYSDLIDLAFEHGDFDAVKFVLAHELGHIHCGHVDLWRAGIMVVPRSLFLGRSVSRAQEYTADRCAAYYAPEGATSMMALFAGKRAYRHVDLGEYLASVEKHNDGFWMKFANFWSGHAVGFRRMQPIADIEQSGWDVHGKML